MKKTRKVLAAILAMSLSFATLTGCQKNGETSVNGKTKLLLGLPGGDGVTAYTVVNNFIEERKDKYEIEKDEAAWGDFTQKIKLQMVAKNDVVPVFVTDSANATSFAHQGALENIKKRVEEDLDVSLYNKALTAVGDEESIWGVPHGLNSIAMVYNKDIFDERGIPYPTEDWTWQDMLDMAKELTFDRDGDGKNDVYGIAYWNNITQGWLPFMAANGTIPLKNNYRDSNLDAPEVRDALEKFQSTYFDGTLAPAAEMSAFGSHQAAFAEGFVAMMMVQAGWLTQINKFNPELNYDAQIMPIGWNGERTCIFVPNVWVMYNGSSDAVKDAAWDWMKYYMSEESQMILANEAPSGYPIMKKALDAVSANGVKPEGKDAFYRGIDEFGMSIMENPCSTQVNNIVNDLCSKLQNGQNLDKLLPEKHTELQRELDFYYENM